MAVPDAGCWGWKGLTLMAIPDADCGRGEAGVHISVQTLVVGWRGGGLIEVTDSGCGWERQGFSWQSQTLVVGIIFDIFFTFFR